MDLEHEGKIIQQKWTKQQIQVIILCNARLLDERFELDHSIIHVNRAFDCFDQMQ